MRHILAALAVTATFISAPVANAETAIFAGGCFWCVEKDMDHVKGVTSTISGYAGGTTKGPTYRSHEGYTEAVKIEFDPKIISYESLTAHFLRTIDVTDGEGQFCDRGRSYIPALFPTDKKQMSAAAQALKDAEKDLGQKLAVELSDNPSFYDAEDYHQNYYLGTTRTLTRFGYVKQSEAYAGYREGCGRDARVKEVWGKNAHSFPNGGMGS